MDSPHDFFDLDLLRQKQAEERKRDRHMTPSQKRAYLDSLLEMVSNSEAYKQSCKPLSRLREQRRLLALIEDYKSCTQDIE